MEKRRAKDSAETERDDLTMKARALHTSVYKDRGFIDDRAIVDGYFQDEYTERSRYFFQEGNHREVGARLISATKKQGIMSLPTMKNFVVDPDLIANTAGVNRVSDLSYKKVVEVSGLASRYKEDRGDSNDADEVLDPVRLLYASLLRYSIEQGHELWALNADPLLLRDMRNRLGHDQVVTIGEKQSYMGPPTIPAAINPQRVVRDILSGDSEENRAYIKEALNGVNLARVPSMFQKLFEDNGIGYTLDLPLKEKVLKLRTLKAVGYSGLVGYSAFRALPVSAVEEFHGSIPLFFAIDVGTAFTQVLGMEEVFSRDTYLQKKFGRVAAKTAGMAVATGSFIAPYVYFYSQGEEYPAYVNGIVAGFAGVATTGMYMKHRRERRLRNQLMSSKIGIS